MNILNKILEKINLYRKTIQIKIFFIFCFLALFISFIQYKNLFILIPQFILYYLIAEDIICKIYGNCIIGAWINVIFPIIGIIIVILDYLNVFKKTKNLLEKIKNTPNKIINKFK